MTKRDIEQRIQAALRPERLEVHDESEGHAGHAGSSGGGHFRVSIVAAAFEGKSLVDRQRMVYALFDQELRSGAIHAIALSTRTPSGT